MKKGKQGNSFLKEEIETKNDEFSSKDNIFQKRMNFSTISYLEVRNAISDEDKLKFFYWWFGYIPFAGEREDPSLKTRITYFIRRANLEEIIFPGPAFERILSGYDRNDDDGNILLYRIMAYLLFPVIIGGLLIFFALGLLTFGYCWPKVS